MKFLKLCGQWSTSVLLLISDACVLIGIEQAGLTTSMFSLPYQFAVPDVLFFEELSTRHVKLMEMGLMSMFMRSELIHEAYNLRQQYCKPSVNDLLALVLAKDNEALLLTGDKALREVANIYKVEVHGTIWLVDQMIQKKIITIEIARIAFQYMKNFGSRLPWKEVDKLLGSVGNCSE